MTVLYRLHEAMRCKYTGSSRLGFWFNRVQLGDSEFGVLLFQGLGASRNFGWEFCGVLGSGRLVNLGVEASQFSCRSWICWASLSRASLEL